ncbi:MAG TPA: 8-amino-7-oxononanoate synthase [Planctomycetota bacterium]|nr:8-amino-7-oxononanoate synthase [Planctomycetota bacterium]
MLSEFIRTELEQLRRAHLVRDPRVITRVRGPFVTIDGRELLGFCSNDYLGIGQDPRLAEAAGRAARDFGWGAASSRALSGTTRWHAELEDAIAGFKGAPAALYFPSGYMANLALVTCLASPDTTILSDELNHASLIDACRLSRARVAVYPHKDVAAAERLLKGEGSRKLILTDTVFSMDGDLAPLEALRALGADVVVDDVHGLGVFGPEGRGTLDVPVLSGNLSKAAGGIGGFIAGSRELIELVRSRGRAFLFTTAPPAAVCAAGIEALGLIRKADDRRRRLWDNIRILGATSPIYTVVLGSNERALEASRRLFELGFFVPAIRPPSVAPGTARLRVTVTAMHEREHVEALVEALRKI